MPVFLRRNKIFRGRNSNRVTTGRHQTPPRRRVFSILKIERMRCVNLGDAKVRRADFARFFLGRAYEMSRTTKPKCKTT